MATISKDFKVKNGLLVAGEGVFGGPLTAGDPTSSTHVATKAYVDALTSGIPVGDTAPSSPENGNMWFDTVVERLNVYYSGSWLTIATSNDLQNIPDHIHDTAIDGTGRIVTVFWDGAQYDDPQISVLDGGTPSSTTWDAVFDGGSPVDNFN